MTQVPYKVLKLCQETNINNHSTSIEETGDQHDDL